MKYKSIVEAIFKSRPNRFIAICELNGEDVVCHVKNTGRCRELLVPECKVFLDVSDNPKRKTKYDLVAVLKGKLLINMDSQAPNRVFYEWLSEGGLFDDVKLIRPEVKYNNSRFDFYMEHGDKNTFIEVKGVTLEDNGVLMFPDAPTERGVKHLKELCLAVEDGYEAYVVFVVQMSTAEYFMPNRKTHPQFADALSEAEQRGVKIICLSCDISPDKLKIKDYIPVKL